MSAGKSSGPPPAGATPPAPEPAWHWVTHYVNGPAMRTMKVKMKIVPADYLDDMASHYAEDRYVVIHADPNTVGVPVRNILHTNIEPCQPDDIPEEP